MSSQETDLVKQVTRQVTALVVTFNRRVLLERCLSALASQTRPPDRILIVDNASTDGTAAWVSEWTAKCPIEARLVALTENTGGAGGFSEGLRLAIAEGADWVWMMDDDAEPHPDALEELMRVADDPGNVYGSLATCGADAAWEINVLAQVNQPEFTIRAAADAPARTTVNALPFLGFMIHRALVERIGLPDAGFFIAADDVEYSLRARRADANIVLAGKSRIEHPKAQTYRIRVPGRYLNGLTLPPWKRYYDTRNRLLVARKHYGVRLITQTIPGLFVRLAAALLREPRKWAQLRAFLAGFTDGLLGLKGKRHEKWGIRP
jgi:GT2 family glycosyltransferase